MTTAARTAEHQRIGYALYVSRQIVFGSFAGHPYPVYRWGQLPDTWQIRCERAGAIIAVTGHIPLAERLYGAWFRDHHVRTWPALHPFTQGIWERIAAAFVAQIEESEAA